MSWRIIVVAHRAKLDYKLDYMVVRGESVTRIHLSEIAMLIIESTEVSLTVALLSEMTKRKITSIFRVFSKVSESNRHMMIQI